MSSRIPVIDDLAGITTALKRCGAAVLRGGLPSQMYASAVDASERLFSLGEDERMGWRSADPFGPGYLEYGRSRAGDTGIPNLLEAWTVNIEDKAGFPEAALPGAWQALSTIGGSLRDRCRDVVVQLDRELGAEGALTNLLSPGLRTLLVLHYPQITEVPEGSRRQSVHVDASLVTLLPKATAPGLTVFVDGVPVEVEIADDDVLIISGSALEKATAGQIPACSHTVRTDTGGRDRYSLILFGQPDSRRTIVPLESTDNARHQEVTDHNRDYFSKIFPDNE